MTIYINGIDAEGYYDGLGTETIGYSEFPGKIACVPGQETTPYTRFLQGFLDDFAMWSRALSGEEVVELFENGLNIVGKNETTSNRITLTPNPVNSFLNLIVEKPTTKNLKIELFDLNGRNIQTKTSGAESKIKMDMRDLTSGLYLVKVSESGKDIFCSKIIKE
jgi:hypothetical protein